jgi:hypothetical protein
MGGVPTRTNAGCMKTGDVLSVGAVARAARVAPRTVAKWFDAGLIAGFRLPDVGGSGGDRRVERAELVRFLTARGMPLGELAPAVVPTVLAVGLSPGDVVRLGVALGESPRLLAAADLFRAGTLARDAKPRVVVADDAIGSAELRGLVAALRNEADPVPVVVLLAPDAGDVDAAQAAFCHPCDFAAVAAGVRRLMADPDARTVKVRKRRKVAV